MSSLLAAALAYEVLAKSAKSKAERERVASDVLSILLTTDARKVKR